jgi:uncharacterized lipoprotein NlpE involved in copper resistance
MKKYVLLFVALIVFSVACNNDSKQETAKGSAEVMVEDTTAVPRPAPDGASAKNSLDVLGIYKGVIPCADCEGIETIISLQSDSIYTVATTYLGKQEKAITAKGKWNWVDGFTIALNGITNAPNKYFVGENKLMQLDMNGQKITGELAAKYHLTKQ